MTANYRHPATFPRPLTAWFGVLFILATVIPACGQGAQGQQYLDKGNGFAVGNRVDSASIYLNRALTAFTNVRDNTGIAKTYVALGNLSIKRKRLPPAKQFFSQSLEFAKRDKAFEVAVQAYDGLARVYEAQKDFKNAIASVRFMQGAYDSIMIRDHRRQLKSLENKYTTILRDKDSLLVIAEAQHSQVKTDRLLRLIERDDIRLTFYLVALALSSVLIFFFSAWLVTRQQAGISESRLKREQAGNKLANEQFEAISRQIRDELSRGVNDIVRSQQLIRNMIDTMWLINPNNKSLESLIAYIREQMNAFLKQSGVNYMIVVPDKIPNVILTILERLNLFSVTRDVVTHAVNCSKTNGLTLSVTLEGKQMIFKVFDNSPADNAKAQKRTDELAPYREKMEQINGTIGAIIEDGSMVVIFRKDL